MKITEVIPRVLSCPLRDPVLTSFGAMRRRTCVLVQIETDAGITGVGESWTNFPHWAFEERRATVREGVRPLLLGEDPRNIAFLWEKLFRVLMRGGAGLQWGAEGPLMQAISGADIALWDILGQSLGVPVFRLLGGGGAGPIAAYASGLGPEGFEPHAEAALKLGYPAFKLKVGFGREIDLRNLRAMREIIGPTRRLMIDANQAWRSAAEALDHLNRYRDFDLALIEEPVPAERVAELRTIRDQRIAPVAGGENLYGRSGFRHALEAGPWTSSSPTSPRPAGFPRPESSARWPGPMRFRMPRTCSAPP
jgi:L-alanine-DL-glutamate epimerase-like enolase superfamily enzyme